MRRMRLVSIVLVVVLGLAALVAVAALGNPTILPTPTVAAPLIFTAESGEVEFLTKTTSFKCEKFKAKGQFTSSEKGQITENDYEGCKSKNTSCNTKGDKAGIILLLNEDITIADFKEKEVLMLGLVIAPLLLVEEKEKDDEIECAAGTTIITILPSEKGGGIMGRIDEVKSLVKTKTALLLFDQKEDVQELKTCEELPEFCKGKTWELLMAFTVKEGELLAALLHLNIKVTFGKEAEFHF